MEQVFVTFLIFLNVSKGCFDLSAQPMFLFL